MYAIFSHLQWIKIWGADQQTVFHQLISPPSQMQDEQSGKLFWNIEVDDAIQCESITEKYSIDEISVAWRKANANIIQDKLNSIITDDKLTPQELQELVELTTKLNFNLESVLNLHNGDKFKILYYLYLLDNAPQELATSTGILLDDDEYCVGGIGGNTSELHEWRKKRGTVFYAGPRYSIPTGVRGLSYRMGAYNVSAPSHDELTLVDYGGMYFTNKRFIFDGEKKNATIKYRDLIKYEVGRDFVSFEKANGKAVIVKFNHGDDISVPRSSNVAFRAILEKYVGPIQ